MKVYIISQYLHSHNYILGVYDDMTKAEKWLISENYLFNMIQTVNNSSEKFWSDNDNFISIEEYLVK